TGRRDPGDVARDLLSEPGRPVGAGGDLLRTASRCQRELGHGVRRWIQESDDVVEPLREPHLSVDADRDATRAVRPTWQLRLDDDTGRRIEPVELVVTEVREPHGPVR